MQKAHGAQCAPAPQGFSAAIELGATSVHSRDGWIRQPAEVGAEKVRENCEKNHIDVEVQRLRQVAPASWF